MRHALFTLLNSPILWTMLNAAQGTVLGTLLYLAIIYPHSEAGFYSWHPIKRVLFLLFLPYILIFKFFTAGCHCGCCCHCQDDD
ncbi:MAG: hypothetical protein ABSD67_20620 [Terracidiphilus sp.]|jgi:hypothetical protein